MIRVVDTSVWIEILVGSPFNLIARRSVAEGRRLRCPDSGSARTGKMARPTEERRGINQSTGLYHALPRRAVEHRDRLERRRCAGNTDYRPPTASFRRPRSNRMPICSPATLISRDWKGSPTFRNNTVPVDRPLAAKPEGTGSTGLPTPPPAGPSGCSDAWSSWRRPATPACWCACRARRRPAAPW